MVSHNGPHVGITMLPMQILPLLFTAYAYILARKNKEKSKEIWLYANISNGIILLMFLVIICLSICSLSIRP
ncbi:hypothetical protein QW060_26690 [Myroides ceti]|uniref:Uncharacterized protein n=1 Tax=Paenimyroides ceti TaxID=395087 RepID=A0ABT8D4Q0_9FLAO|nr:hypothetical protein [Paenimyroides ceti]MDN3710410.1 hypothetical protein [Paenimyroides ceti]